MRPVTKPVRGRKPMSFGGHTYFVRAKLSPVQGKTVKKDLKEARDGLFRACNGGNPSVSQEILIDRIITNLSIVRSMEERSREGVTGVVRLPDNHLSYCSQISRDLKALGLDGKFPNTSTAGDKTVQEYLDRIDGK